MPISARGAPPGSAAGRGRARPVSDAAAEVFPPELEFLARHGVPGGLLREAERRAARNGTAPSEELPALGIDGRRYGSLLAEDLGLTFLDDLSGATPLFRTGQLTADAVRSASATMARLGEGTVLVLAPRPDEIALLRGRLEAMPTLAERLRIATPEAIRTLIASRRYPALVHYAVHRLVRVLPRLSSGSERWKGVHGHRKLAAALLGLAFVAPLATVDGVWLLITLFFLNCNFWRLAAAFRRARPLRVEPVPDARLPRYSVLVPLYREAAVVSDLVEHLARLDYPALCIKSTKQ